jgi:N-acetylglucosaminyl-diphospho-decaprenol L-rhamnosyltransferase
VIAPDGVLVTVVVVTYNAAARLPACLTAMAEQTLPRHRFEVIVVDNASADGTAALARREFPWCHVVASRRNRGFAGGNALGIAAARGDYVALLNDDAVPDPFWLEELLRPLASPTDAAVSKLVLVADPTTLNSAGLTLLRDGRGADRGYLHADRGQYECTEAVFAGCGAALLLPRRGRLLDPDYFLYYEDLELGWRRRRAGLATTYAPRSLVRHAVGAAGRESSPLFRYHVGRNRALTSLRHGDAVLAARAVAVLLAKAAVAAALGAVRGEWAAARAVCAATLAVAWRLPRTLLTRGV